MKAMTWRILATCLTAIIALVITGNAQFALEIGVADMVVKIFVYYLHERAWTLVPAEQPKRPDYEI